VLVLRSILFNLAFYAVVIALLVIAMPLLLLPGRTIVWYASTWGRINVWLLRVICGTRVEWRGLEKIPPGPLLVAAKHQSAWETFALLALFSDPTFILKRELLWIPFYGWLAWKAGMIPVNRRAGREALAAMTRLARAALAAGKQIVIFPEGTRRPPGAEPKYKFGIAHLYAEGNVPCLPIALNSGLYWPRRRFLRYPGTIRVQILDPIPPGLDRHAFFERLQNAIEPASAALIEEGRQELGQVAEPDMATA
jgi:1-acyl-sn-glycerol-3-phosphate acyltransferase